MRNIFFQKIITHIKAYWKKVEPEQGVILFMVILLLANELWKLCIKGDEMHPEVFLFGKWDISNTFNWAITSTTTASQWLLNHCGFNIHCPLPNQICHENSVCVSIIWGCTAIKQSFIFLCIMIFARGKWKQKYWFIPFGLVLIYLFNILRISSIVALIKYHPEWFTFLHGILLKYIFYIFIFFIWVFWEEKLRKR